MAAKVASVVRVLSFPHGSNDFAQLRVSVTFVYMLSSNVTFHCKEMHCETPLSLLSLALVITVHCDHLLILPVMTACGTTMSTMQH